MKLSAASAAAIRSSAFPRVSIEAAAQHAQQGSDACQRVLVRGGRMPGEPERAAQRHGACSSCVRQAGVQAVQRSGACHASTPGQPSPP